MKILISCSSRTSGKFGRCWIACTEKCPELFGYFSSAQNLLLLYCISKVPFLPHCRVEIQKRSFCAWEECFALGVKSQGVTCVPVSPLSLLCTAMEGELASSRATFASCLTTWRHCGRPSSLSCHGCWTECMTRWAAFWFHSFWNNGVYVPLPLMWKNSLSHGDF